MRMMAVTPKVVDSAAVAGSQARDQVEQMQAVGVEVYLAVGEGMAETIELGLGEKIYHADENLVDLGQSIFYNIPKS